MSHRAVVTHETPEPGSQITGFMPQADPGDNVTIIANTEGGRELSYGTVIEKDLSGYEHNVAGHGNCDFGKGFVKIQVDES